jgi:uncharacterized RDD family membrane protein YckC
MKETTKKTQLAKKTSKFKIIFVNIVDLMMVTSLVFFSKEILKNSSIAMDDNLLIILIMGYFYLLFIVIPINIFSQTFSMFILGIKVVSAGKFTRLGTLSAINHSLYLWKTADSCYVDIR